MCKADSKMQRAWKQKSLDEKRLRFVMKRSSIPTQLSSSTYVNHGVLANHKAAAGAAASTASTLPPKPETKGFLESRKKSPSMKAQQRMYVDDFADFDCLLEEEATSSAKTAQAATASKESLYRDSECQTGEELIQAMFLQLRRRRFQSSSGNNTPSPRRPTRELGAPVKEVTFNTHVVPVHVDSSWSRASEHSQVPEQLPLLSRNFNEENYLRTGEDGDGAASVEAQRRLSDLSSLSYMDGASSPEMPVLGPHRRSSDTSDVSSHRGCHQNIYHRPPTPRTPRKLLIQNNHNDIAGDSSSCMPRGSLPSPHLLNVQEAAFRMQASSSSQSLSSLTSEGSRRSGGSGKGRGPGGRGSDRSEEGEGEEEEGGGGEWGRRDVGVEGKGQRERRQGKGAG